MKKSDVSGVRIAGIASAVPDSIHTLREDARIFGDIEIDKISSATGINARRIAPVGICASDLCYEAARGLFDHLKIDKKLVDAIFVVTQTPDYFLPATACSLHGRLGLSPDCAAFDINLGCSGYTYGLWLGANLIKSGAATRVLLLAGETITRVVNERDRSARLLFGDAGTATLLESGESSGALRFVLGTDGGGQNDLIVPAGTFRLPFCEYATSISLGLDGNARRLIDLHMDGSAVFVFTLDRVVPLLKESLRNAGWQPDDLDAVIFHQANEFMLKHIAKATKIDWRKVPCSLKDFGNTSSASIPLTMTTRLAQGGIIPAGKYLLAGFGVGLSWCSVAVDTPQIQAPPLVEVNTSALLKELYDTSEDSTSHLPEALRQRFGKC
jgi:3-oxoacyl-[acyl-carrier-protein] synthase-3